MQKFYRQFDTLFRLLLNIALVGTVIVVCLFYFSIQIDYLGYILGLLVIGLYLLCLLGGLIYISTGTVLLISSNKKNKSNASLGKELLIKGLKRIIIVVAIVLLIFSASIFISHTKPDSSMSPFLPTNAK